MFKKLIIILSILLVSASIVGAGTFTTNGLYKPGQDENSWGDLVNTNFDIIDSSISEVNDLVSGGSGYVINPTLYADLTTAIAACTNHKMVISTGMTLDANTVFPVGCELEIIKGGSIASAGFTVTFNNSLKAGPYSILTGFSAGDITFGNLVREWHIEWLGALADGVADGTSGTDNTTALQLAFDTLGDGQTLLFSEGIYLITDGLDLDGNWNGVLGGGATGGLRGITLKGVGQSQSIVQWNAATDATKAIFKIRWVRESKFEDIVARGTSTKLPGYAWWQKSDGGAGGACPAAGPNVTQQNHYERIEGTWTGVSGFQIGNGDGNNCDSNLDMNTIEDSIFAHNVYGIAVWETNANYNKFITNLVSENRTAGVRMNSARNTSFDNNLYFGNATAHYLLQNGAAGMTIENEVIELQTGTVGVWNHPYLVAESGSQRAWNIEITNLQITNSNPDSTKIIDYQQNGNLTINNSFIEGTANQVCTGSGAPLACCTGLDGGTCTEERGVTGEIFFSPQQNTNGGRTLELNNVVLMSGAHVNCVRTSPTNPCRYKRDGVSYQDGPTLTSGTMSDVNNPLTWKDAVIDANRNCATSGTCMTIDNHGFVAPHTFVYTVRYADFTAAAATEDIALFTMPKRGRITKVIADTTTAWQGPSVSTAIFALTDNITAFNEHLVQPNDVQASAVRYGDTNGTTGWALVHPATITQNIITGDVRDIRTWAQEIDTGAAASVLYTGVADDFEVKRVYITLSEAMGGATPANDEIFTLYNHGGGSMGTITVAGDGAAGAIYTTASEITTNNTFTPGQFMRVLGDGGSAIVKRATVTVMGGTPTNVNYISMNNSLKADKVSIVMHEAMGGATPADDETFTVYNNGGGSMGTIVIPGNAAVGSIVTLTPTTNNTFVPGDFMRILGDGGTNIAKRASVTVTGKGGGHTNDFGGSSEIEVRMTVTGGADVADFTQGVTTFYITVEQYNDLP
jgi:hypothetical protein